VADVEGTPTEVKTRESALYRSLVLLMATLYAVAAVVPFALTGRSPTVAHMLFGFDQLRPLGWFAVALPVLVGVTLRLPWDRVIRPVDALLARIAGLSSRARVLVAVVVGTYSFTWFLGLRNQFINPDGSVFSYKFHADIPVRGATVSHDEILEFYVHSRFWYHTSRAFGWTVEYSYQFLSSVAGGIFVVLLLILGWMALGDKRWIILALGVGTAGFMQLFFGDVENYTLVTALILLYLLTAYAYLEGRIGLLAPNGVLALAVTFHLLAAFLLVSLAYLYVVALQRRQLLSVALAAVTLIAIPAAVLVYFNYHGLPLNLILTSNAFGQAGKLRRFVTPSVGYYGQIVGLLFLLFPPLLCFLPLLAYKRIALTQFNIFMALAVIVFMGYVFTWNAALGVYNDWNLYAPAALPLAVFFWYNFARADWLVNKAGIAAALILTSGVHSYAWIIRNHV
jgi:hypothetical protein